MPADTERAFDEVTRLKRCLNDLISALVLPATW
jgi:hypothetical protein